MYKEMKINYVIKYEKPGEVVETSSLRENEIWLDVGNELNMGCFDHHQTSGYESSLMALLTHPEYLDNLRKSIKMQNQVIVHMHENPDLDCIACFYMVRFWLEHTPGEFTALFGETGICRKLIWYVNDIDSGKNKIVKYPTLYAVFCAVCTRDITDDEVVEKGIELIDYAVQLLKKQPEADLFTYDFTGLLGEKYAEEIDIIDHSQYEEEKKTNRISFERIPIWTKDGRLEKVTAAIWKQLPIDGNGYVYAREEGNLVTVVPYSIKGVNGNETTRVFVSINPAMDYEKKYTLKPIAERLEKLEQQQEECLYQQSGCYRRDHSRPRSYEGILSERPFSVTSDPWFVSPEEDLIDAPRAQSVLEYEQILHVIRNSGRVET